MKKIMFNDKYGLTQAVLEGRKTMTRRLIPKSVLDSVEQFRVEYYNGTLDALSFKDGIEQMLYAERNLKIPFRIQDDVAISQSYKDIFDESGILFHESFEASKASGYTNKMFVKADLMPHRIKITNIRVERLQDISDEDCLQEGLEFAKGGFYTGYNKETNSRTWLGNTPREAFSSLIDKVSGKGTWDSNPWVVVYSFELIK